MNTCTCHTEGCPSAGAPVAMMLSWEQVDDETGEVKIEWVDDVVCGACGREITDIAPPLGIESES